MPPIATVALDAESIDLLADVVAQRVLAELQKQGNGPAGWLDTKRAAAYAGCSVKSLHKAMASRALRFSQDRPGGKCWFKREWLDEWREG
jgi:hypothetical protein